MAEEKIVPNAAIGSSAENAYKGLRLIEEGLSAGFRLVG